MKRALNIQSFEMEDAILRYDAEKAILLCQSKSDRKKRWIKKLYDLNIIANVIEDNKKYYLACDSGDIKGQFLAIQKESGITKWFIPGKSFLQVIYKGFLYLIFADEDNRFYLLKVHLSDGKSAWFHPVDPDLVEYMFVDNRIKLRYSSGKTEVLSVSTGRAEN